MKNSNAIVAGSIGAIASQSNRSIAETFISADCIVIVDTSASMDAKDNTTKTRYDRACDELASLQKTLPGKIAVLSFSDTCVFCPNGVPVFLMSGTNLKGALQFAKVADIPGAMKFIVISDGQPDDETGALAVARTYTNPIDVIYVGSEVNPTGRDFLQRLAKAAGGQAVTADAAKDLAKQAQFLLTDK